MRIEWLGHSCFKIENDESRVIITDPFCAETGIKVPDKPYADVVTVSHHHGDHDNISVIGGNFIVIEGEGNHSVCGIDIKGITLCHDKEKGTKRGKNIVFVYDIDGIKLCHMGDIGEECTFEIIDKLGEVDVLMLPVGGTYTVDAVEAKAYVDALRPSVVIPMHYKSRGCVYDIQTAEPFLDLCDKNCIEYRSDGVLLLKKQEINNGKTRVIVFSSEG